MTTTKDAKSGLRIAVVMDPWQGIVVDHDTTYVIMAEATRRGHEVFHVTPDGVVGGTSGVAFRGRTVVPTFDPARPCDPGPEEQRPGDRFDVVLIRTDPPFDDDYLAVTWLLDLLPERVFVMNEPRGLRAANEKLAALRFPELTPRTCVSQSVEVLDAFRREVGGDVVLKPLDGFAGRGVLLARANDPNLGALFALTTRGGRAKALAQELVPGAKEGDKRVLVLDGEPLGAVLRKNLGGGFTHNLATGGSALRAEVDERDREIVRRVAPWLRANGLHLAGLDVLGGKLIEINVTSPTCVQELNRLENRRAETAIVDYVERRAGERG